MLETPAGTWTNVFGNVGCPTARHAAPETEADLQELVAGASSAGIPVRVAGAGHSVTPLVATDGLLLDLSRMGSAPRVDASAMSATVSPGGLLADVFDPLWAARVALRNLGETDAITVGGAISTGVHGTGLDLRCMSASVRGLRLVTATGELLDVSRDEDPELLRAAALSLGLLGVITELTLDVVPAYDLYEQTLFMDFDEMLERWDELLSAHRHFSFFYFPNAISCDLLRYQTPAMPEGAEEICCAVVRDARSPKEPEGELGVAERRDRMNRILVYRHEPTWMEIEFMVPLDAAKSAVREVRALAAKRYSSEILPIDVRFIAADDLLLSPFSGAPKAAISVTTHISSDHRPLLLDFEEILRGHGGVPHWGKNHSMDFERAAAAHPGHERFRELRAALDPSDTFLNHHLRALFAPPA